MTARPLALLAAVGLLLVACATTPVATGRPSASAVVPPPTAAPTAVPSVVPEPPASPTPVSSPAPSPTGSGPDGSDGPVPTFSAGEAALLDAIRSDARVDCRPRRADLPPGAAAGIECRVGTALVDRVGVYRFDGSAASAGSARDAYLARLASAGVTPHSGDCAAGRPGDASWPASLPDEGEDGGLRELRAGCYLDATGMANVRVTCYGEIYIGILGANGRLADLNGWAWKVADGESVDRDPPGICAAAD